MTDVMLRHRPDEDPFETVRRHPIPEPYAVGTGPKARPPRRRRRWLLAAPALGALGFGAWLAIPGSAAGERDDVLRQARALGLPDHPADLVRPLANGDNAADDLLRAIALAGDVGDAKGPLNPALDSLLGLAPGDFGYDAFRDLALDPLDAELLPLLEAAASKPDLQFPRDYSVPAWEILFPEFAPVKSFTKYLAVSARRQADRGNGPEAMRRLVVAANLARLMGREPTLIGGLVSVAQRSIVLRAAQECLAATGRDPATLAAARGIVPAFGPLPEFRTALKSEWAMQRDLADRMRDGRLKWDEVFPMFLGATEDTPASAIPRDSDDLWRRVRFAALRTPRGQAESDLKMASLFLDYYRSLPSDPFDQKGFAAAEIALTARTDRLSKDWTGMLAEMLFPVFLQAQTANIRAEAQARVFDALIAALDRPGPLPARLPVSGQRSLDPFTKGPLLYRVDPDGSVRVWSVGADGTDEGGRLVDGGRDPARQGDVTVLWPLTTEKFESDRARHRTE